jgi:hypothetical protein
LIPSDSNGSDRQREIVFLGERHHGGSLSSRPVDGRPAAGALPLFVLPTLDRLQVGGVAASRVAILRHVVEFVSRLMSIHKQVPQHAVKRPEDLVRPLGYEADVLALLSHNRAAGNPAPTERGYLGCESGEVGLFHVVSPPQMLHLVESAEEEHPVSVLHAASTVVLESAAPIPRATKILVVVVPVVVVRLAAEEPTG